MELLMVEEIHRTGLQDKIALKKIIFGSERSSDAMRQRIKDMLGLEEMFDLVGMTELYGPGTGQDCTRHEGIHYWADYYLLEILDRKDDGKDYMVLKVEIHEGTDAAAYREIGRKVATAVKKSVLVSCEVEVTPYGALPPSARKSKRVFDNRS
jgi:phenylacetate-coenzyme A ligase PaaK-like adenylate-forming protein